jgi:hypothetical protein
MKAILKVTIIITTMFLLTGCRLSGDYPYRINPAYEYYYLEGYQFTVGEDVIYELTFPDTVYVSSGMYDMNYEFEVENDYRMLHDWLSSLLTNSDLTKVYETVVEDKKVSIRLSEGASKNDFNYTEFDIDQEITYIKHVNFMLESGYMFYVVYVEFDSEGETYYIPNSFGAAYEVVYIPETFDIVSGNSTYNGVALERRFASPEYNYNYVYILPFPLVITGGPDNEFIDYANGQYSGVNITAMNELTPSIGNDYRLCETTDETEKCFRYIEDWFDRIIYLEGTDFDDAALFYETYYNGYTEGDSITFSFNNIEYKITNITGNSYRLTPVMVFDE